METYSHKMYCFQLNIDFNLDKNPESFLSSSEDEVFCAVELSFVFSDFASNSLDLFCSFCVLVVVEDLETKF